MTETKSSFFEEEMTFNNVTVATVSSGTRTSGPQTSAVSSGPLKSNSLTSGPQSNSEIDYNLLNTTSAAIVPSDSSHSLQRSLSSSQRRLSSTSSSSATASLPPSPQLHHRYISKQVFMAAAAGTLDVSAKEIDDLCMGTTVTNATANATTNIHITSSRPASSSSRPASSSSSRPASPPQPITRSSSSSSVTSVMMGGVNSIQNTNSNYVSADTLIVEEINKTKWRNRHLHKHFINEIPSDQICLADFSCALEVKGVLRQGRLYFTSLYVAFHSPIGTKGGVKLLIHVSELEKVEPKRNLLFPTSIYVYTKNGKIHHLTSFIFRSNALNSFGVLMFGWKSKMAFLSNAKQSTEDNDDSSSIISSTSSIYSSDDASSIFSNQSAYEEEKAILPSHDTFKIPTTYSSSTTTSTHPNPPRPPSPPPPPSSSSNSEERRHGTLSRRKKRRDSGVHTRSSGSGQARREKLEKKMDQSLKLVYMSATVALGFTLLNFFVYLKSAHLIF